MISTQSTQQPLSQKNQEPDNSTPFHLLSAHLQIPETNTHALKFTYTIVAVFSHNLDPMSVRAEYFLVVLQNGQQFFPRHVTLEPANEVDEHRTVHLQIEVPKQTSLISKEPAQLIIIDSLYSESGEILTNSSIPIRSPSIKSEIIAAEQLLPNESRCPHSAHVLRTYWTLPVVGNEAFPLHQVKIFLADGNMIHPSHIDDHERSRTGMQQTDNVIDFCLQTNVPPVKAEIIGDVFVDANGNKNRPVIFAINSLKDSSP